MALLGFFAAMSASSMLADTASLLIALGGSILATFIVVVMGTRGGIFETSVVATLENSGAGSFSSRQARLW